LGTRWETPCGLDGDRTAGRKASVSLLAILLLMLAAGGCHRAHYRQQADHEAYELIREKATHPLWSLPGSRLTWTPVTDVRSVQSGSAPDARGRSAAHQLMQCVDGKSGYSHWDANGFTPYVENPDWLAYLSLDANGC